MSVGWLFGGEHLLPAAVATLLCLPPAVVTLLLADVVIRRAPVYGPAAVMVGTAVRMLVAVVGVVLLEERLARAGVERERFAGWVVFLYLTTLVAESVLLIRGVGRRGNPVGPAGAT